MLFAASMLTLFRFINSLCRIIGYYRIFKKFGEPGWKSLIPFYNIYVEYKKVWCSSAAVAASILSIPTLFLPTHSKLFWVAGIAFVAVSFVGNIKLSKCFGHGIPFALGLTFVPAVFLMILGFNSDEFTPPES